MDEGGPWTEVLDDCRRSVNDDGVIDIDEAQEIVADVLDGPKRQGSSMHTTFTSGLNLPFL